MLARIQPATERRAEVIRVACRIRDDVVAPTVEDAPVRIGEAVADVDFELPRARLEAIDRRVAVAHRAGRRLHLRAMEDAVAQINCAAGIMANRVGRVMRIRAVHAHQHALLPIRLAIAIRVAQEPQVRRLHQQQPILVKLEARRAIQVIDERRHLVRLAVAIRVLEDQNLVTHLARRRAFGIIPPRADPQPALRVPHHLHRVDQIRELLLIREEVHLHV